MEPGQVAVVLASPFVAAVVGVLLWWRVGQLEKRWDDNERFKQQVARDVAEMKGAVAALKELVSEVLHAALGRRRGNQQQ